MAKATAAKTPAPVPQEKTTKKRKLHKSGASAFLLHRTAGIESGLFPMQNANKLFPPLRCKKAAGRKVLLRNQQGCGQKKYTRPLCAQ